MTTIINAVASSGLTQTADGSGIVKLQSNGVTTNALAWVSFTPSTGAIRSSYNVGSVTRNATGDYTVNFSNALSDANYATVVGSGADMVTYGWVNVNLNASQSATVTPTTTAMRMSTRSPSNTAYDPPYMNVAIFGN
jgi:hypothetical protein